MAAKNPFRAEVSISIKSNLSKVWNALTNPDLIKQYFLGVNVVTNWRIGSPILYKGEWEGHTFEDKGIIRVNETEKRLEVDYWPAFSGTSDAPENYQKVTYTLKQDGEHVLLAITQDNIPNSESVASTEKNWLTVLNGMKSLLEKP
jgi:uncharacterized protein YndB with AHSA1/START domain